MQKLKRFFKEEEGITGLEYTVLAALIITVIIVFFSAIQTNASKIWSEVNSALVKVA